MSHYQIGLNLDYFAPGHLIMDPDRKRTCAVYFVNKTTLRSVTCESVLLDALNDPDVRHEFYQYNQARETLFNSVMQQFGLKCRFKCVLLTSDILETIAATLATCQAPDPDWWETNCYFVNGARFPGVNADPKYHFCGYQTKYEQHWRLICKTFYFVLGHNRSEYNPSSESSRIYRDAMGSLLMKVKSVCGEDITNDYECVLRDIEAKFEDLAGLAPAMKVDPKVMWDEIVRRQTAMMRPSSRIRRNFRQMGKGYRNIARIFRLHVWERFKLEARLTRISIEYPQSGNDIVFR
jgi:hypothetical protein